MDKADLVLLGGRTPRFEIDQIVYMFDEVAARVKAIWIEGDDFIYSIKMGNTGRMTVIEEYHLRDYRDG